MLRQMLCSELFEASLVSMLSMTGAIESSISSLYSNNFLFGRFHPQSDKALRLELMASKDLWKALLMRGIMMVGPIVQGR